MVARGVGMGKPYIWFTASTRARPIPTGDHEDHPYGLCGLVPVFVTEVDAY